VIALGSTGPVVYLSCVSGSGSNKVAHNLCTFGWSMSCSLSSVMYLDDLTNLSVKDLN
jgi:hypothetical protein